MKKCCTKCGEEKSQEDFVKSKTTKSGYRGICKTCFNAYYEQRRVEKYEQVRSYEKKFHRQRRLKHEYGITEEEVSELNTKQGGKCAICKEEVKLVIDHCHTNGHVRGLLCSPCNVGLGHFKDNVSRLLNAINYLVDNAN